MALKRFYVDLTSGSNARTQSGDIADNWANAWLSPAYAFAQFAAGQAGNDVELYIRGTTAYAPAAVSGFLDTNGHTATSITVIGEGASAILYDTSKARLEFSDIYAIYPRGFASKLKFKKLQFKITMSAGSAAREWINGSSFATGFTGTFEDCRVELVNNHPTNAITGFGGANSNGVMLFVNTMVVHSGIGPMGYGLGSNTSGNVTAVNCLVDGPAIEGYRKANAYNCIDVRSTVGFNNDQSSRPTLNCASGDGSASTLRVTDWSAHFTNRAIGDYSLKGTSSLADAGADRSGLNGGIITDIQGQLMGASWPIGPDEFVDGVSPLLSLPLVLNITDRAADARVTTTDADGKMYVVFTKSATQPSRTQIIAGQDHTGSTVQIGSAWVVITSAGTITFVAVSGLAAFTDYYAHFLHQDAAGNYSNTATSAVFKTLAPTQDPYTLNAVTKAALSAVYESNAITASVNTVVSIAGAGAEFAISTNGGANYAAWTSIASTILTGNLVKFRVTSSASLGALVAPVATIGGVNATWNVTTRKDGTAPIIYPPTNRSFNGTPTLAQNNPGLLAHLATAYARDNEGQKPPTPTQGQTVYYVDQSHPNASDILNNGTTEATPWLTLDKAYATAQPGNFIYVKGHTDPLNIAATYNRPTKHGITVTNKGTVTNRITYCVYPGHTVILQGNGSRNGLDLNTIDYHYLYGFIFDGFIKASDGDYVPLVWIVNGVWAQPHEVAALRYGLTCEKCEFRNCTDAGLRVRDCIDYTFIDCNVHHNGESGFSFRFCHNTTLIRCHSHYNDDGGTGDDSDADGYHAIGCTNLIFIDCDAHHNTEEGWDICADAILVNCGAYSNSNGANGCNIKLWRRADDQWVEHTYYLINTWVRNAEESGIKVLEGSHTNIWNCVVLGARLDEGISYRSPSAPHTAGGFPARIGTHTLYNTIMANNNLQGCDLRAGNTLTERNCLYHNNIAGNTAGFLPDVTSITGQNPLFVSEATLNFNLQAGSPAINRGRVITGTNSSYLEKDYNKRYRPATNWDIGIAEYSAGAIPLAITSNIATLGDPIPVGGPYPVTLSAVDDDGNQGQSVWQLTVVDSTLDYTPDLFDLGNAVVDAALGGTYNANQITVTGVSAGLNLTVLFTNCEISINGAPYLNVSPTTVRGGQTIDLRVTASQANATTVVATLAITGISDTFSVTTLADTLAPIVNAPADITLQIAAEAIGLLQIDPALVAWKNSATVIDTGDGNLGVADNNLSDYGNPIAVGTYPVRFFKPDIAGNIGEAFRTLKITRASTPGPTPSNPPAPTEIDFTYKKSKSMKKYRQDGGEILWRKYHFSTIEYLSGASVVTVVWAVEEGSAVILLTDTNSASTQALISTPTVGQSRVRCTVTLSNGEVESNFILLTAVQYS